jgi:hypothetical protein
MCTTVVSVFTSLCTAVKRIGVYRASEGGVCGILVRVGALEVIRLRDFSTSCAMELVPAGQGVHNVAPVWGMEPASKPNC